MALPPILRIALAGAAATWCMDRIDKAVYLATPERVHRREAELEELTGPGAFARAVARRFGRELDHDEAVRWGRRVHVAYGISAALAYPAVARRLPPVLAGVVYGAALAPANLFVVPALGLTPPTRAFPMATTVRGLIYHLGYGVALDACTRVLRVRG